MVAGVLLVHVWGDIARDHGSIPIPGNVWTLLLFIPVVYGGTNFGFVGSLGAAVSGVAVLVPEALFTDHTGTGLWQVWGVLTILTISALILGDGYEHAISLARQSAEVAALRDSEERFRLMFDAAPTGMALVDLDMNFLRVNPALCQMVGRSETEVLRLGVIGLTVEEDREISVEGSASRNECLAVHEAVPTR